MARRHQLSSLDTITEHWDDTNGSVLTVTVKERYPVSSEALMKPGFFIILLNMAFGVLPITISGSKIKFYKCSVSKLYAAVFGICMLTLSGIFVPQQLMHKMKVESPTGTGMILTGLVTLGHVFGFLLLLIRGHWLANGFPKFWTQLTKLLQKSVIDIYGVDYKHMKLISCFARRSLIAYFIVMALNEVMTYFTDKDFIVHFFLSVDNDIYLQSPFWYAVVLIGYLIWGMCNLSHMVVCMLLCFLIMSITVCLRSINDQLQEIVGKVSNKSKIAAIENQEIELRMTKMEEKRFVDKLDTFTMCYALCQELTSGLSRAMGISIILEVLVAVINLLGQVFSILKGMYDPSQHGAIAYVADNTDNIMLAFTLGFTHFYFLFKLSCFATEMAEESKLPLTILNLSSYHLWPTHIQKKIQAFKMDIANTSISLSASNYFQVNKYLITSVFGAITTYLIVLLQFTQTEQQLNPCKASESED